MAEEKANEPLNDALKVVRNVEIAGDGKVLIMLGSLVVEDGRIVGIGHRAQLEFEATDAKYSDPIV